MENDINMTFSKDALVIQNIGAETDRICEKLKDDMHNVLKRKGAILGVSGGIDSSVTLALAVKAFGPEKVVGIMLPVLPAINEGMKQ